MNRRHLLWMVKGRGGRPQVSETDCLVAQNLRRLRRRAGLPMHAVAAVLGLSYQAVQRLEKGACVFADVLARYAALLNVSVDEFFRPSEEASEEGPAAQGPTNAKAAEAR